MTAANIISTMGVLLFTISIIWGIAWLAMRFQLVPGQKQKNSSSNNSGLIITETLTLDTKRRLVKVEDDGFEHLLLLGPTTETHIHSKKITHLNEEKTTLENDLKSGENMLEKTTLKDKALH